MIRTLGYVALVVGIGVIGFFGWVALTSLSDIRRYLRIRQM